ncbi:hypothetical protein SAMN05444144_103172 [Flavobacterium akiainvivens]|nr:hypothetical protein SAMN05444144_103172 [Flavobacterium akiainvivens]
MRYVYKNENETRVLILGIAGFLLLIFASMYTHTHYFGVLDARYLADFPQMFIWAENGIVVALLFVLYSGMARYINGSVSWLQVLGVVLISRVPFVLFTLLNIKGFISDILIINSVKLNNGIYDFLAFDVAAILLFVAIAVSVIATSVYLLYSGFTFTISLNRNKHKALFFMVLLVCEIVSRILIYLLL